MTTYQKRAELLVDEQITGFVEHEVLAGLDISKDHFWKSFSEIVHDLGPLNRALLEERVSLQCQLDVWNASHQGNFDLVEYKKFLFEIGYLVKEGPGFQITTDNVDAEIGVQAGPQLVVPAANARFALNAANARWGSLYDALYGTDVISSQNGAEKGKQHNPLRAQKVVAYGREFLNEHFPLLDGSHTDVTQYMISGSALVAKLASGKDTILADLSQLIGYQGATVSPSSILMKHNGLHIAIEIDRNSTIGKTDKAGVKDITMEAALTAIQDFEDSVVAVNASDKTNVYRNWLGLIKGNLTESIEKSGKVIERKLARDKQYLSVSGDPVTLHGRSLMLCRNVGHLMSNPAILDRDGLEIQEGIMDAMISVLISTYDVNNLNSYRNSRNGNIYIVKPKMHGPKEVAFTNTLYGRVESALNLPKNTIKIGVMDEERRTTVNLKECIRQVSSRIVFINTGFLDRTGDEIHTSMLLGPMALKTEMKNQPWIAAYENWNVDIGLECGFSGRAQIGKGMWALPDEMAAMMKSKIAHPQAGANTAWVPSPTAATLHAMHYHQVKVFDVQHALHSRQRASLDDILTVPLLKNPESLTPQQIENELNNNAQGLLGYVVRWIDLGMGASKVPDINNVELMEDRATLRISSQHICNWLEHGIVTETQVKSALEKMAKIVDQQNAHDPKYKPMSANLQSNLAFQAALDLVFNGKEQPSGYTEPLLHKYRQKHNSTH